MRVLHGRVGGRRAVAGAAIATVVLLTVAPPPSTAAEDLLHAPFDTLLAKYVNGSGVRYDAWSRSPEDLRLLAAYVDTLEAAAVVDFERDAALAYWINLYNAVTLELVLSRYPVDSIKDTAGFLRSPWNKKLVVVGGKELTLNAIENEIIRSRFGDPRIHFALNCASIGCPPLAKAAHRADHLNEQLESACRLAMNDPRYVRLEGSRLVLTKIFDWYGEDFSRDGGSVPSFVARYRKDVQEILNRGEPLKIEFAEYDWSLNRSR